MKKTPIHVRMPYSGVRERCVVDVVASETNPSRTHQSFKESCCLNNLVDSVRRTGVIPPDPHGRVPRYGDVSLLNRPFDELLQESRETRETLVKFSEDQREQMRLANIEKRKKLKEDAEAYRASLAAVGKNNTTESQST